MRKNEVAVNKALCDVRANAHYFIRRQFEALTVEQNILFLWILNFSVIVWDKCDVRGDNNNIYQHRPYWQSFIDVFLRIFFFWGFEESTFKFLVDRKSEPEIDFITSISNILFYLIEKVLHLGLDQPCTATAKSMLAKNEARHFFKDLLVLMKVCIQYTRNNIQKIRSAYMKCGNKKMFHFDLRHHTIVILKTSVTICKEEKKLDNQMSNNIKISISYSYTFFSYIKWKAVNYVIFLTLMG